MNRQVESDGRKPWLGNIVFLLVCCIAGAALGALIFKPLLGKSEAIGVIAIGSIGSGDTTLPLEPVSSLTTRMLARDFAAQTAKRLSDTTAAQDLLAPVYGGRGDLSVRTLRDANQIEIRVRNASEQIAIERVAAVMQEVLDRHTDAATNLLGINLKQQDRYRELLAGTEQLDKQISEEIKSTNGQGPGYDGLLAAKSRVIAQGAEITRTLIQLEQATTEPFFRQSQIIAGPSPLRPLLKAPWQTAILGALAGFALGFVSIQIRRALV